MPPRRRRALVPAGALVLAAIAGGAAAGPDSLAVVSAAGPDSLAVVSAAGPDSLAVVSAAGPDSLAWPAGAELDVREVHVGQRLDALVVDVSIDHLLDADAARHLASGVPATVILDVELWRQRGAWFDRFEASQHRVYRLRRNIWDEVYELARIGDESTTIDSFADLHAAERVICQSTGIVLVQLAELAAERTYYLVVSVSLKPMTLEDVDELESWLSGDIRTKERKGLGILGLPKQIFGLLLNLTGLHDRNTTLRTRSFSRREAIAGTVLGMR